MQYNFQIVILIFLNFCPNTRGQFHQLVNAQLLQPQILKAQKAARVHCFFALLGSARVKAAHKMLVKLTPGSMTSMFHERPEHQINFENKKKSF